MRGGEGRRIGEKDGVVPVLVVGGHDNALSIARSLGARGIPVRCLGSHPIVARSRYATAIPVPPHVGRPEEAWADVLLGPGSEPFHGSVLLAASDPALKLISEHRVELAERYVLDLSDVRAQLVMLDKLASYAAAREAGIPTPRFWVVGDLEDVDAVAEDLAYPLLIKPLLSHEFQEQFAGAKFVTAEDFPTARRAVEELIRIGIRVMLVERVPGPDSLLASYYTYIDENGHPLFHFTKRIVRRYPVGMGLACCEVVDRMPEVQEVALRFIRAVGLRGLANAEFKRDPRDGTLRLIECNARFTAANGLVHWSGLDLASLVYNRLTGAPPPPLDRYRTGLSNWHPRRDIKAYRQLRATGDITLTTWLRSLVRPIMIPYLSIRDPMPAIVDICSLGRRVLGAQKARWG